MKYTFGTSNHAAKRLEEMAKFFNPLAAEWLRRFVLNQPTVAIDLGCGPGFTTEMLSRVTQSRATYGLDNSETFLEIARTRYDQFTFLKHDITECPFPIAGDIMYARFVLSHQQDPLKLINDWATQLKTKGIPFIDELEDIETNSELFKIYLSTNASLVASQGAQLFVGEALSVGKYPAEVIFNDSR